MKIFNNVKYRHAFCLTFGGSVFTSLTMLRASSENQYLSEKNLPLECPKFSAFFIAVII